MANTIRLLLVMALASTLLIASPPQEAEAHTVKCVLNIKPPTKLAATSNTLRARGSVVCDLKTIDAKHITKHKGIVRIYRLVKIKVAPKTYISTWRLVGYNKNMKWYTGAAFDVYSLGVCKKGTHVYRAQIEHQSKQHGATKYDRKNSRKMTVSC